MKLLITGCGGQLGEELQTIIRQGKSQLGAIDPIYHNAQVIAVDVKDLDITNQSQVEAIMEKERPDIVINCAAYTNVDGCERDKDGAFRVNAIGSMRLAIACEKYQAKLCQISTDYVFDGNGHHPYCEYDRCAPTSVYGATKLLGEEYTRDFCSRYFIVRTSWLYGKNGKNFVKTVLRLMSEQHKMTVVNDQFGNPTYANDLAHHILKIILTDDYGIYHCSGNGVCSWYEFAKKIVELSGMEGEVFPCTSEEYKTPTKRPAYSALDHTMLRCTIGDDMRHWEDALSAFFLDK